ncbi:MAG: hypothetical protein C0518_01055 [Opitutus sp.]|nr:hypothetical protein [Opitutus sp.]
MWDDMIARMTEQEQKIISSQEEGNRSLCLQFEGALRTLSLPTTRDIELAVQRALADEQRHRASSKEKRHRAQVRTLLAMMVFFMLLAAAAVAVAKHLEGNLKHEMGRAQRAERQLSEMDRLAQQTTGVSATKLLSTLQRTRASLSVEGEAIFFNSTDQQRYRVAPRLKSSR